MKYLLITSLSLAIANSLLCRDILISDQSIEDTAVYGKMNIFFDASDSITLLDLLEDSTVADFEPLENMSVNLGFTSDIIWLKFNLKNISHLYKNIYFKIAYPLLNEVQFFEIKNKSLSSATYTGLNYPFFTRGFYNRNYVFLIDLKPLERKEFYVKISNDGSTIRLPLSIDDYEQFHYNERTENKLNSLYYGLLIFAVLFNIFLFITIREKIYWLFAIYMVSLALFLANIDGMSFEMFWPNSPWWANHSTIVFVSLTNLFFVLFSSNYLRIRELIPKSGILINILVGLAVITFFGAFTDYPLFVGFVKLANLISPVNVIIFLILSLIALSKGERTAILYLVSCALLIFGVIIYVIQNLGLVENTYFTEFSIKFGLVLQSLFLTFAVINRLRKIMLDQQLELEYQVNVRTKKIISQNTKIEEQSTIINEKNRLITAGIQYARQIQNALLPSEKIMNEYWKNHFIVNIPKDIVSGDFYWCYKTEKKLFIALGDCTGHGVSGAFMSLLGITYLNDIMNDFSKELNSDELTPSIIIKELSQRVKSTFNHYRETEFFFEGIDISLCMTDQNDEITFAGAKNPLFIIRDNKLTEYKGDRSSAGFNAFKRENYTDHKLKLQENDMIYLFSDGYYSQINYEKMHTFKYHKFKELLISIHKYPLQEQSKQLTNQFLRWKSDFEQTDDILIIGLKYKNSSL